MDISPDQWVLFEWRGIQLNATIVFTWMIMAFLTLGSWAVTSRLRDDEKLSRWQNMLEIIVQNIRRQIRDVGAGTGERYLPFIGTLFLFLALSNFLSFVPGYRSPAGSLSTTAGLAFCVLFAVPLFAIPQRGLKGYLKNYIQPTVFMLPFNIIGELSRTIALAVRLYGNVMSGAVIAGILISIAPFFFPVLMDILGLITGLIQAYIFAVLAMVYIASAARTHRGADSPNGPTGNGQNAASPSTEGD